MFAGARLLVVTVLLVILGVGSAQAQDAEATTRVGAINIQPEGTEDAGPKLPARLAMEVQFSEPSGNNMIDANETGRLLVSMENRGQGQARGIDVWATPDSTLPKGLTVGPQEDTLTRHSPAPGEGSQLVAQFESLPPSKAEEVEIPLQADGSIPDREVSVTVHVTEKNGFGPGSPVQVRFPTRAFRPPALVLAGHAVDGSGMDDGRIGPSEIVDVQMRIQNEGLGPADGVAVEVEKGSPNVFFTASSDRSFEVGPLGPSEKKDISVQVYANNRAEAIPLVVQMKEHREEFSARDTLRLDLDRPEQELRTLVAEGGGAPGASEYEALGIDVEQNIPETPMEREDAVAVVIGLERYPSEQVPDVEYAYRDASFVRKYLTRALGYREENILPRNPARRMTSGQMKTVFQQQLPSYVREGSEVFVYYSGHGAPSDDGEHAYLVPSDADPNYVGEANSYRLDRFREDLTRVAENKNLSSLTVVLDACFSGQNKQGDMMIREASPLTLSAENPLLLQENATVFTAGTSDQVANWYPDMKHGMFTYFFLKALQGEADQNGDRQITVREVMEFVQDERDGVPYWSRRLHQREQTPQVTTAAPDRVLVHLAADEE